MRVRTLVVACLAIAVSVSLESCLWYCLTEEDRDRPYAAYRGDLSVSMYFVLELNDHTAIASVEKVPQDLLLLSPWVSTSARHP